jgi:NitT/TauT family transport system substrate-binding protein
MTSVSLTRRVLGRSLLGVAAAAATAGGSARGQELTKLMAGYPTVIRDIMGGYYTSVPKALFWKAEGLDVTIIGLPGANAAAEALEVGRVDVALMTNSATFALLDKFPDSTATVVYTFANGFNALPEVASDSPLRFIQDLAGKRVGVQNLANSQVQVIKALTHLDGGDAASIHFVAVGEGAEEAQAVSSNRVDAVALYDGAYAQIESEGVPLRELPGKIYDPSKIGFISGGLTRKDFLAAHRDTVVRFFRGIAKGTLFAHTSPEAAVRIHWMIYPESRPRDIPAAEAMRRALMQVNARLKNVFPVDGLIGNATVPQIDSYQQLLLAGGVIKQMHDPQTFWQPDLLRDINDFDHAAVRQQALDWHA